MPEQAKRSNDLTPFEAALAGLAPRVEGFDRERLIFLAGHAAALRDRGAGGPPAATSLGGKRAGGMSSSRWAWPTAFAAMTAVAATLLVMLGTRSAPMVASDVRNTAVTHGNVSGTLRVPTENGTPLLRSGARPVPDTLDNAVSIESDPAFRAELRRHGIDFGRPRVASSVGAAVIAEGPLTYYELLRQLQKKEPAGQGGLEEMMQ